MLEVRKKWMSASEARQSIATGDFFRMLNGNSLVITAEAEASAAGKVRFDYLVKETGETGVSYLEGLTRKVKQVADVRKVTIPCGHADNSTCHGEHVAKVVPSNKREKQHRKIMLAVTAIKEVLPNTSDDIVDLIHSRWYEHAEEVRRIEAEAEAKKAAIAAKKQQEAEAKKQQELINTVVNDLHALSKYMTQEQAVVMLSNKYGADVVQSVVFGMV